MTAEADSYRERVTAEAQQEAQRIREEARSTAQEECAELKRRVTYEVQSILTEIDTIRAAAQEELEAQMIYSEVANIKASADDIRSRILEKVDRAFPEGKVPESEADGSPPEMPAPFERAIESESPESVSQTQAEEPESQASPKAAASRISRRSR